MKVKRDTFNLPLRKSEDLNAKIKIRERENTFECEYTGALARINIDKVEPKIISNFFSCKNNSRTRRPWSDHDVISA